MQDSHRGAEEKDEVPEDTGELLRVAVIGTGRMGRCLATLLKGNAKVTLCSREPKKARALAKRLGVSSAGISELSGSDVVIAAIPTEALIKFAEEYAGTMRPDATFVDVSSVKIGVVEEVLKRLPQRAGYASIHPLFTSPRVKDKDIAFMVLREAKTLKRFREALARSAKVFETTPEEHDRATAITQVLHHFALLTIERALLKHVKVSETFKTNSLRRTLAVIRTVERNRETVITIQKLNRFGKEAREEFIREAEAFNAELSA
ncbi:MAG: prephenate dehydrogenase/arogenate dehydrogenase family protein [Candidatus Methanosuratincola petrocarbonis]